MRHIGIGFLVSFLGSLPLGYLNVAGLEVYKSGISRLFKYFGGIITVEVIIIYLTLIFAEKLIAQKKLLRLIEALSIVFMIVLAIVFYRNAISTENLSASIDMRIHSAYLLGVLLSCFNFLQLPFWTGWNLYLLSKKHIESGNRNEFAYIAGTAAGTFCGMLVFVTVLAKLDSVLFSGYLMYIVALGFALTGVVQAWKFYRKYYLVKG